MRFSDRIEAGRRLADRLQHLRGEQVVVLGLPRGGVPVAAQVADSLDAPLDVIVVRKLGVPFHPELGMGAIGEDGVRIVNDEVVRMVRASDQDIAAVEARERVELERRAAAFRGSRPRVLVAGRTAVIIDDGVATGSTARAACEVARAQGAERVVLAAPVAPPDWVDRLRDAADELVAVDTPDPFFAIGEFYDNFTQTTDDEVLACLERASHRAPDQASGPAGQARDDEVEVAVGGVRLGGHLTVPEGASGVVVFAHGSGSSRHSPRNQPVAAVLHDAGLGTLLFDLLTDDEARDRANVFDIDLLAGRLVAATAWLREQPGMGGLPVGYFGASTGAAAALSAAAEPGLEVAAVVSRGGRGDLAGDRLTAVKAPTLLIVGALDHQVLELNRTVESRLAGERHLAVIPGATHLFEEPGTLDVAARLARDWFRDHLRP